ncbi:MAG: DUF411 domain-containing protein [Hyphomicrobiaceae bacterium]|nr:MAG: DUF411 domain-containing protein [Hyphomicrobiaceae bacterium]
MKLILKFVAVAVLGTMPAVLPSAAEEAKTAIMYKPLQCGCCDEYAKYLESHGFKVTVQSLPERRLDGIKRQAAVPRDFEGCHTLMVDGYVVEGLVPIGPLNKLLTEKPNIKGISLPGMPIGSPGMPGRKTGPLIIYELPHGSPPPKEFARE